MNINFATCFGLGYIRLKYITPGTATVLISALIYTIFFYQGSIIAQIIWAWMLIVIGYAASIAYINTYGDNDHVEITIDEFAGHTVALIGVQDPFQFITTMIIFGLLDCYKPLLIGYIDRKASNKVGVMLDDILAGIITIILVRIIFSF